MLECLLLGRVFGGGLHWRVKSEIVRAKAKNRSLRSCGNFQTN